MRKIILAAAAGLALVAGQAAASNGAAESLRLGDRVGAAMGEREDIGFGSWLAGGGFFGGAGVAGAVITSAIIIGITIPVVDAVVDDDDDSPSN